MNVFCDQKYLHPPILQQVDDAWYIYTYIFMYMYMYLFIYMYIALTKPRT